MKKVNISKNAKLLFLGVTTLLFSSTAATAQVQFSSTINTGSVASAIGYKTNATGNSSFSSGYETTASGPYTTAFGYRSVMSGGYGMAAGFYCTAAGAYSFALGARVFTGAAGSHAFAMGIDVRANANRSMTFGSGVGNGASNALQNNIANSLMIGFQSTVPSLFVGPSSGAGTTGRVGIGTTNTPTTIGGQNISTYRLFVAGGILTEEVRVRTGWADYVFADDYQLPTLTEVGAFIAENGHLPNVPSAQQVEEEGIEIGEITRIQQEKIEELTLYMIEMQKEIEALKTLLETQGN